VLTACSCIKDQEIFLPNTHILVRPPVMVYYGNETAISENPTTQEPNLRQPAFAGLI
jgi:hypothetical protein